MKCHTIAVTAAALALCSRVAHAESLTVTTSGLGSLTHSFGTAIAKVVTEATDVRLLVQPQGGNGLNPVSNRTAEFGFANIFDVVFFTTGTGEYQGRRPQPDIRLVARIVPNLSPMLVKKNSSYKTVRDLKGKRIPGGFVSQRSIRRSILAHLVNAGLSYSDVVEVLEPNVVKAADDFMSGRVESFTFGLGAGKVREVAAAVGGLRALPTDTSPEAIARMRAVLPGSYLVELQPSSAFPEITARTPMMAFDFALITNIDVADDVVYKVTRALHTKSRELSDAFAGLRRFRADAMAIDYEGLTYHPGAIKYYGEIGQWPPKAP